MNKQGAKYKISPRGKRKLDYPAKTAKSSVKLPLIGKTIYLDVKETKHLRRLQQDLKKLGATLEDFVSRDINYLITSQPRPKNKATSQHADDSPSPSPFNCDPSPSPGYPEDRKVTSVTRGKALLEKARCRQQTNTLLDNAEKWGVKIVSIEGAFKWLDKELKKLPKSTGNLSKKNIKQRCVSSYKLFKTPFVKVEAESFCYRPFHMELDVWPRLNVDTPRGSCPFDGTLIKGGDESREERGELLAAQVDIPSEDTPKEEKDGSGSADRTPKPAAEKSGKKSESDVFGGSRIMTAGEVKRRKDLKRKLERKRGYCECCHVKYEDLDKHVKEDQHRQYVKNKTNYGQLDTLINSGPNKHHFLFEYLTKAAHLVSGRNGNSTSVPCDNNVRRSPRKNVQSSTLKSPSKPAQQPGMQSPKKCQSPGKIKAFSPQTVQTSPRKSIQKLNNDKTSGLAKTPDLEARETKKSSVGRTEKNCDTMRVEGSPNLQELTPNTATASSHGTPRLRHQTGLPKEKDTVIGGRSDFGKVALSVEEETEGAGLLSSRKSSKKKKSLDNTLSKVNENKVLEKSPVKKQSPKKQLIRNFSLKKDEECDINGISKDIDKENVSPCKNRINMGETHTSKSSQNEEKLKNKETYEIQRNCEMNTPHKRCTEKSSNKNDDFVENLNELTGKSKSCDKNLNKSISNSERETSTLELDIENCEVTRVGFAEIVKYGKERIEIEHSSDDFEVCFARSLEGEVLPHFQKGKPEESEKTFDEMVVQYEQTRDVSKFNTLTESETDGGTRMINSPGKKHKSSGNKNAINNKTALEQTQIGTTSTASQKEGQENKLNVYDIDMDSDIPSDFQCYDEQGKVLTFSKTLADRIKERSVGRRSSVQSYNVNVLFQLPSRSRSNSFSSNQSSERTTKTKRKKALDKGERKKSGSSIASEKVLNKYRNKRFGRVQNESKLAGYQGDDENERTPDIRNFEQRHQRQKKPKNKFWHYEPVVESEVHTEYDRELKGLEKELKKLKEASAWCSTSDTDTESRRSRMKLNKVENMRLKGTEAFANDKQTNNERLSDLNSNQRSNELKGTEESERAHKNSNKLNENRDSHQQIIERSEMPKERGKRHAKKKFWYYVTESVERTLDKKNECDQKLQRKSRQIKTLLTDSETEIKPHKGKRNSNNQYSKDSAQSCKTSLARNNKTETKQKRKSNVEEFEDLENAENKVPYPEKFCVNKNSSKGKKSKSSKVYWDYIPVDEHTEEENFKVPKELRDSWNTGDTLDRCDRRRSRTIIEKVGTEDSSTDEVVDQNTVRKRLSRNHSQLCESSDKVGASEKDNKSNKSKSLKKFWDFLPVEDKTDKEITSQVPKILRDTWNTGEIVNRYDRRKSVKFHENVDVDTSSSNEDLDQNTEKKSLKNPDEKFGASKTKVTEDKHNKDWDYTTEDNSNGESSDTEKNLKEGRYLKFSKSCNSASFTSDKGQNQKPVGKQSNLKKVLRTRNNKFSKPLRKREMKINYNESDCQESDSQSDIDNLGHPTGKSNQIGNERDSESDSNETKDKCNKKYNNDEESVSQVPKILRDTWNTGEIVNRYERRKCTKSSENVDDTSSSNEDLDQNIKKKFLRRNQSKLKTPDDKLGASKTKRTKVKHKYWDYIIEDNRNEESQDADEKAKDLKFHKSCNLTKVTPEILSQQPNLKKVLGKRDKKFPKTVLKGRHLRKREMKVDYKESDCQESDSQSDINNIGHPTGKIETDSEPDLNEKTDKFDKKLETLEESGNICRSKEAEKEPHAENVDKCERRRLQTKNSKHYCETRKVAEDSAINSSDIITAKRHLGEIIKPCDRNTDRKGRKGDIENSDSDRSRSRSRKKVQETSSNVNKSLHKELQILQSTWNDLKTFERKRSKSYQSRLDASDSENTDCEKKHKTSEKYENRQVKEDKVVDGEVSYLTKCGARNLKKSGISKRDSYGKNFECSEGAKRYSRNSEMNLRQDQNSDEEESQRSTSPVFSMVQNPHHKVIRRSSPVFNRSPRQHVNSSENGKKSDVNSRKQYKCESRKYVVKGKSVKTVNSSNVCSKTPQNCVVASNFSDNNGTSKDDFCSDSEDDLQVDKPESVSNNFSVCSMKVVTTPEKSEPIKQPGSGYSETPREKRRKQWKRKTTSSDLACPEEKKRKLDKTNAVECSETVQTDLVITNTPRRRLIEFKENREGSDRIQIDNSESKENNTLAWKPVSANEVDNKCEKVKLNRSWTMLSERSISKLLSCEDDSEHFDGFTDEDKMPSDMSYEEQSEVEIPNDDKHEWVVEDKDQNFEDKYENSEVGENLVQYVPVFFPSPNKTSNSSWIDAVEDYIDNSVKLGPESSFKCDSSSVYYSFNRSPRKSPKKNWVNRPCTPKRKRNRINSPEVERVDDEIEFNFGSPQKNRSDFSPLKSVNGVVRNLSGTVNLTSTPVLRKPRNRNSESIK